MENLCKSADRSTGKHQSLYKCATPPWKDTYRKRCFDRLKKSRDRFMDRFRLTDEDQEDMITDASTRVKSLMTREWRLLKEEQPGLCFDVDFDNLDGDVDEMLQVFEEIRRDLIDEEQAILREYEAGTMLDEQSLTAAIESHTSVCVMCPVCQKNRLYINKGVVFCKCGVRVNTEQDCVTLKMIEENVHESVSLHGELCQSDGHFSVINQLGMENLFLTCETCDFMYIVV